VIDTSILIHIWQLFISSILVFFIFALLIEVSFYVFKIKNPRMRSLFRLIPILKLPFDFVIYRLFLTDSFKNFNLLDCKGFLHNLVVEQLPEKVLDLMHARNCTSLSGLFGSIVPHVWLQNCAIALLAISFCTLFYRLFLFFHSTYVLSKMRQRAQPSRRPIVNRILQEKLTKFKAMVLISDEVSVPMATYNRFILLPKFLAKTLSEQEFEAVIAHELEHLRWKDPLLKLISALICSFFWWIPSKKWLNKIEEEQENASDLSLEAYRLDTYSLASAVVKTINTARSIKAQAASCYLVSHKTSAITKRLKTILSNKSTAIQNELLANCCAGSIFASFIFLRIWIC